MDLEVWCCRGRGRVNMLLFASLLIVLFAAQLLPAHPGGIVWIHAPPGLLEELGFDYGVVQVSMMGVDGFKAARFQLRGEDSVSVEASFRRLLAGWAEELSSRPREGVILCLV